MFPCLILGAAGFISMGDKGNLGRILEFKEDLNMDDCAALITCLYWNLNGFDCSSTCAGEVRNPRRDYIWGLLAALALIILTYFGTFLGTIAHGTVPWNEWRDGSLIKIAEKQSGHLLAYCL